MFIIISLIFILNFKIMNFLQIIQNNSIKSFIMTKDLLSCIQKLFFKQHASKLFLE